MARYVVTGGNRGIGLAMVEQLVARGDEVLVSCRQASAELRATGAELIEDVDVTTEAGVQRLRDAVGERRVDVLINNAGVLTNERLGDVDVDRIRQQFETNALAPLRVTDALRGSLGAGSRVAIVTSRMGSMADNTSGGMYGYRMSKAAVNMAGVSLAHDLRGEGVHVLLLHPGFVRTRMTGHNGNIEPEESAAGLLKRIDELDASSSGRFLHVDGSELPW